MTFPIQNMLAILRLHSAARSGQSHAGNVKAGRSRGAPTNKAKPVQELVLRHVRLSAYGVITALAYLYTFPLNEAKEWHWRWIAVVVSRNMLVGWLLFGSWHWFLYDSPWGTRHPVVHRLKYNPVNQYDEAEAARSAPAALPNLRREQLFTTCGLLVSSLFEVLMLRLWATGAVQLYTEFWATPVYSVVHILVVPYWRDLHFYFAHRVMHPWRVRILGVDPGWWLFKHVHSLHHKSRNPGPWAGLSMHPLEHLVYYTCTLTPLLFTLHPAHFLFNKFHADIAPVAGHDGHDKPAGGSLFHYLHHERFECNYGTPMVPLDKLFGTYDDGSGSRARKAPT